jgi:hypothetical protein
MIVDLSVYHRLRLDQGSPIIIIVFDKQLSIFDTERARAASTSLSRWHGKIRSCGMISFAQPLHSRTPLISPSDPSSAWANKRVQFGYGLNYLIDVEHAVIVDVEPTPARTYDEVESSDIQNKTANSYLIE